MRPSMLTAESRRAKAMSLASASCFAAPSSAPWSTPPGVTSRGAYRGAQQALSSPRKTAGRNPKARLPRALAPEPISAARPFVAIVDDDESVRESLPGLLSVLGFDSAAFASARAFLASDALRGADCLILDIAMPGMSGPELMQHPEVRNHGAPVIVITAMQNDSVRREMLELGAVELLFKPFGEAALIAALAAAIPTHTDT